jgi:hypothetical protein
MIERSGMIKFCRFARLPVRIRRQGFGFTAIFQVSDQAVDDFSNFSAAGVSILKIILSVQCATSRPF